MANHVSRDDLPAERMGDYEGRMGELGDYTVTSRRFPRGFRPAATMRSVAFPTAPVNAHTGATSSGGPSS